MRGELGKFELEDGTVFKYRDLTPMEAIPFGVRVATLLAPVIGSGVLDPQAILGHLSKIDTKEANTLLRDALAQCYTPDSKGLNNEAVFNDYFGERPEHLFEAGVKAVWSLANPFLPQMLRTESDGKQSTSAVKQSEFRKGGK